MCHLSADRVDLGIMVFPNPKIRAFIPYFLSEDLTLAYSYQVLVLHLRLFILEAEVTPSNQQFV